MSEWQLAQALVLCTEALSLARSTNKETSLPAAVVVVRVLSPWHSMQELLLMKVTAVEGPVGSAMTTPARTHALTATTSAIKWDFVIPIPKNIKVPRESDSTCLGHLW